MAPAPPARRSRPRRAVHQPVAGIGHRGHAAVGDERHRAPRAEAFDQLLACARVRCLRRTTPSACADPGPASSRPVRRVSSHATRSTSARTSRAPGARDRSGCRSACRRATACPAWVQGDTMLSLRPRVEGPGWKDSGGGRAQGLLEHPLVEEARDRGGFPGPSLERAPDGFDEALIAIAPLPPAVDFLAPRNQGHRRRRAVHHRTTRARAPVRLAGGRRCSPTVGSGSPGRRRPRRSRPT